MTGARGDLPAARGRAHGASFAQARTILPIRPSAKLAIASGLLVSAAVANYFAFRHAHPGATGDCEFAETSGEYRISSAWQEVESGSDGVVVAAQYFGETQDLPSPLTFEWVVPSAKQAELVRYIKSHGLVHCTVKKRVRGSCTPASQTTIDLPPFAGARRLDRNPD
jgi:hypothetical protein